MRKRLILALAGAGIGIGAMAMALGGGVSLAASGTAAPSAQTLPAPPAGSPLATLVANGTLTQAQATAIQNGLVGYMRDHWPPAAGRSTGTPPMLAADGPLTTVLSGLVKDGTLTQAQATAVQNAVTQQVQSRFAGGTGPMGPMGPGGMRMYGGPGGAPFRTGASS